MASTPTREQFAAQREARRGAGNPERMDMPVWEWLVREGINAWQATERLGTQEQRRRGAGWCFDRFGCSRTALPDGRVVHIAGEHEDYYDPDFYIYNDVIVRGPDDAIAIYGYSGDVFPPTDFHTATLAGDAIWIVGNCGYTDHRQPGVTPVYRLSLQTLAISSVATSGEGPGWIHRHAAELSGDGAAIVIRGGQLERAGEGDARLHTNNVDDWSLDLASGVWTRLSQRPWQQWSVRRADGEPLMLWDMYTLAFELENPSMREFRIKGQESAEQRLVRAGRTFDAQTYKQLYGPPVEHEALETEGLETALQVGAAEVRYDDRGRAVVIKIVGALADETVDAICDDLAEKLGRLQGAPCVVSFEAGGP